MTIVVFGARGSVGGQVLNGLLEAGAPVRATSRTGAGFGPGIESVTADLDQPQTLGRALEGATERLPVRPSGRCRGIRGGGPCGGGTEGRTALLRCGRTAGQRGQPGCPNAPGRRRGTREIRPRLDLHPGRHVRDQRDEVGADEARAETSNLIPELLGRPARTFADWAADHADAFR